MCVYHYNNDNNNNNYYYHYYYIYIYIYTGRETESYTISWILSLAEGCLKPTPSAKPTREISSMWLAELQKWPNARITKMPECSNGRMPEMAECRMAECRMAECRMLEVPSCSGRPHAGHHKQIYNNKHIHKYIYIYIYNDDNNNDSNLQARSCVWSWFRAALSLPEHTYICIHIY